MSAVAAVVIDNGILIASDGLSYDFGGLVGGYVNKVLPVPHLGCAIGYLGDGGIGLSVLREIFREPRFTTFDRLVEGFAECVYLAYTLGRHAVPSTLLLAGWSDERGRFELYKVNTHRKEVTVKDAEAGDRQEFHEPWQTIALPDGAWCSPGPTPELIERFGILEAGRSALDQLALMVCAARSTTGPSAESVSGFYAAGGFLQFTVVERYKVASWVGHRWPDEPGKMVQLPSADEPLPTLPIVVP